MVSLLRVLGINSGMSTNSGDIRFFSVCWYYFSSDEILLDELHTFKVEVESIAACSDKAWCMIVSDKVVIILNLSSVEDIWLVQVAWEPLTPTQLITSTSLLFCYTINLMRLISIALINNASRLSTYTARDKMSSLHSDLSFCHNL